MSEDFAALNSAEQREVAARLLNISESGWKPFWCPDPECEGDPHPLLDADGDYQWMPEEATEGPNGEQLSDDVFDDEDGNPLGRYIVDPAWAHNHARKDQRLPSWLKPWTVLVLSGRGTGKTTTGVEFVTLSARKGLDGAIIGRRGTELVNTHVATLIARAHPEFMPEYQASKDRLVWPNGAITYLFSAERPENIRSVNLSYFWMDEAAWMPEVETAWMNARLATRVESPGNPIHVLVTSTPTSTKWVMEMEDNPDVEVRRVSTYANRKNLSADFIKSLEKEYEGTRMGRQEIHGEVLRDVEGALWNDGMFMHMRVSENEFADLLDTLDDVVVAVDPAGSKKSRADETGIIAVGAQHTDSETGHPLPVSRFYVLADGTIKGTPSEWAAQTYKIARHVGANRIIAEKNFGGDMVQQTLTDYAALHPETTRDMDGMEFPIKVEHASQSKETRAEPVVGKYEQGRVTHVTSPGAWGDLSALEKEQVGWVPRSRGGRLPSPNRIDASVWAFRALETQIKYPAKTASRREVTRKLKRKVTQQVGGVSGNRVPRRYAVKVRPGR